MDNYTLKQMKDVARKINKDDKGAIKLCQKKKDLEECLINYMYHRDEKKPPKSNTLIICQNRDNLKESVNLQNFLKKLSLEYKIEPPVSIDTEDSADYIGLYPDALPSNLKFKFIILYGCGITNISDPDINERNKMIYALYKNLHDNGKVILVTGISIFDDSEYLEKSGLFKFDTSYTLKKYSNLNQWVVILSKIKN